MADTKHAPDGAAAAIARKARKVQIQREYWARKRAKATAEQLEAMAVKQRKYSREHYYKDLERSQELVRAKNKRRAPELVKENNRLNRERNGDKFNATRRAKYAADEQRRATALAANREWSAKNVEAKRAYNQAYKAANKDKIAAAARRWQEANPNWTTLRRAAWSPEQRRQANLAVVKWRADNPGYRMERYYSDPGFRAMCCLRAKITKAIKAAKTRKAGPSIDLIGCSAAELRDHVAAQFALGMTWDNHGEWQLDHIRQCSLFDLTDPAQQLECFHFTNLRPLWRDANQRRPRGRYLQQHNKSE